MRDEGWKKHPDILRRSLRDSICSACNQRSGCERCRVNTSIGEGRRSSTDMRICNNGWTFVLNDVEFREVTELTKVDKVKIVACDGKNTGSNTTE
uniref:Transcription initiation factor IIA gamma subunit C-terminal domain-containing protein n=1 Tax=Monodon monoceros TaxID=40151 RepID=A0A8C6F9I9_MONMO